ncbi:MAG: hypothetical protein GY816_14745 [Cytophagales bacterium]|nr:hypothetical protein [Cytophagales bacterium]
MKREAAFRSTCEFVSAKTNKLEVFSPSDIRSFGLTGQALYRSNQSEINLRRDTPMFIEVLVEGETSLFYYDRYAFRDTDGNFFELQNEDEEKVVEGRKYRVKSNEFIRIISAQLVNKCFKLIQDANRLRLEHRSMVPFFEKFNKCINSDYHVYYRDPVKVNYGGGLGYSIITSSAFGLALPDLNETTSSSGMDYFGFVSSSLPRINKRFRVQLDVQYSGNRNFSIDTRNGDSYYETMLSLDLIKAGLQLKYHFPVTGKIEIQIGAGRIYNFISSNNLSRTIEQVSGTDVFTEDGTSALIVSESISENIGTLVLDYQFSPYRHGFVELRYANGTGLLQESVANTIETVGIRFGINIPVSF